jgi:hypothetical protein
MVPAEAPGSYRGPLPKAVRRNTPPNGRGSCVRSTSVASSHGMNSHGFTVAFDFVAALRFGHAVRSISRRSNMTKGDDLLANGLLDPVVPDVNVFGPSRHIMRVRITLCCLVVDVDDDWDYWREHIDFQE